MRIDRITVVRDDGLGESNPRFAFGKRPWLVVYEGLENFEGVDHEVSTSDYAQYDGSRLVSERSPSRDRTISAVGIGDPELLRAQAESFFIPRREYEVHVEAGGRRRFCRGRHYAFALRVDNMTGAQLLDWTFLALDPCWLSEDSKTFDIAEAKGKFGFPFVSHLARVAPQPESEAAALSEYVEKHVKGFVAGVLSPRIEMSNEGGFTAYPVFSIRATGEVVNPAVTVEDSAGVTVCEVGFALTMQAGDELVVDFSARPTAITKNGANASQLITPGSTLAAGIEVGDFTLTWSADSGDAALSVVPTIRERYATI